LWFAFSLNVAETEKRFNLLRNARSKRLTCEAVLC
jgi:hypothetical protein